MNEFMKYSPVTKTTRKIGGKGAVQEKPEISARLRRSKLYQSVKSAILRRRLVSRRDAVRRAKLMRRYLICFLSCFSCFDEPYHQYLLNSSNSRTMNEIEHVLERVAHTETK